MAGQELTLAMRLLLDTTRFVNGLTNSGGALTNFGARGRAAISGIGQVARATGSVITRFAQRAREEVSALRDVVGSVRGRLGSVGVGIGATAIAVQSARLDKDLTQIGLSAGASEQEVANLRAELFRLSRQTGQPIEELQQGFANLVAAGLRWNESLQVIGATNKALAAVKVQADALTGGLTVAATAFEFDLSNPDTALRLLDQMLVAGRLANAELESLSGIFARVGVNSRAAGFGFEQTLAFIEGLSNLERQPERLATLADSTLRLFTNARYRSAVQRATGVRFFDAAGSVRDPLDVLSELRDRFQKLDTDAQRERFISRAFGNTDLDTQRGIRTLLSGSTLDQVRGFTESIKNAGGTLDADLDRAVGNAVDQTGRLKTTLREAADSFTGPINDAIARLIRYGLDRKEAAGITSGQLVGAGAAAIAAAAIARRYGGPLLSRLLGGATNLASGVAAGKALEAAVGVTPVFVTNFPAGGIGGPGAIGNIAAGAGATAAATQAAKLFGGWRAGAAIIASTPLKNIATLGARGVAGAAGGAIAAGAAGYGAGRLLYTLIDETAIADKIGEAVARALAFLGNDTARESIRQREAYEASVKIELDDRRARVTQLDTSTPKMRVDLSSGPMWLLK